MTHPTYTQQQLCHKSLAQLKCIYSEIGCTAEVTDRRYKDEWISAIARYQESKLEKVASPTQDEQAIAQGEFDQYIEDQAEAMAAPTSKTNAPEELTVREINFFDHEIFYTAGLIAIITYDDDLTQPWMVIVNGKERFRANTWAKCHRFIQWHHKDGTLDAPLPTLPAQETILPPQEQSELEESCTTSNEIMVQLFNAFEQHGLELLEHGIYQEDKKLGEVGFTDKLWCFARVNQKRTFCDSAEDAVWLLQIPDGLPTANEYLQYRPLEQLSSGELQRLFETAALVAV